MRSTRIRRRLHGRTLMVLSAVGLAVTATVSTATAQTSDASAAGSGAHSSRPAAASDHAAHQKEVYAVQQKAGGDTSVHIYRPAPGVTTQELADKLRAKGVAGVQTAASGQSAHSAAALPCSYGSARSIACSPIRWAHNGYHDPQVYFLDHSGANWPMTSAVPKWHESVGIDSYYRWHTQGCPGGGTHCPHAYSGSYGQNGWVGKMSYNYDSNRYFVDGTVEMRLNDSYPTDSAGYRNTACHEAGHVLGLGHNTSTSSCMYSSRTSTRYPNSDDFSLLPRLYP